MPRLYSDRKITCDSATNLEQLYLADTVSQKSLPAEALLL